MKGKIKVGLALGGGGARGFAHIGVIEVLQEEGILIDMIAGTSAGAVIGAIYAQGKDIALIQNLFVGLDWKKLASLVDLTLPKSGFIRGKKVRDFLELILGGDIRFSDLKIPLACVATDIITGEEVVIDQGSVLEAVRASISIPGIFTVVKWQDRYLVDGGLVNPVPVSILRRAGIDCVIAVNVLPDITETISQVNEEGTKVLKEPNILGVLMQSLQISQYFRYRFCLEDADIVILPKVGHIGTGDFHRAYECIVQGKQAASKSMPEIHRQLGIGKATL